MTAVVGALGVISGVIALVVSLLSYNVSKKGYKVRLENNLFRKFAGNETFWINQLEYYIKSNKKDIVWSKKDKYEMKGEKSWVKVMAKNKYAKMLNMVFDGKITAEMTVEEVLKYVLSENLK